MKKALLSGISGMDGSYLSEYLLSLGYQVFGIIRRNSTPEHQESRIDHISNKITTFYGDVTDNGSIYNIMAQVQPDEIYNLAAQSHVRISSDVQEYTIQTNAIGVLNMLQCCKEICKDAKFYQASSSEMFGNSVDEDFYQRETTNMQPVSPYGIAKTFGYHMVRHYRTAYGMHTCNGILFNHESPRRGSNFVTNKVIKAAVRIKNGLQKNVELGNLDSHRDWGHAKDYVRAMHKIINHNIADDFVVASGETRTVRYMCEYVFGKLDMDYNDYVVVNEKFFRPQELKYLRGDCSKIKNTLQWQPEYTFEKMIDEMIEHWLKIYA